MYLDIRIPSASSNVDDEYSLTTSMALRWLDKSGAHQPESHLLYSENP